VKSGKLTALCLFAIVAVMVATLLRFASPRVLFSFPFIEEVQQPVTGLADPPTIVALGNPFELAEPDEGRPASVILNIVPGLAVSNAAYASLEYVLEAMRGRVIPVFYINSIDAAEEFVAFYLDSDIRDGILMSSDPVILLGMREWVPHLPGALVVDAGEGAALDEWVWAANIHKARILYIRNAAGLVSHEDVLYLQARLVSVWLEVKYDDALEQLLSGPNGLVTPYVYQLYALYEAFDGERPTLLRRPFNVAHRGSPSIIPQNTLEGAIRAFEDGADVLELDIMITYDNELVIFHDNRLGALTGCPLDRNVWDVTLEEIRALTPNLHGDYAHSATWHPEDFCCVQIPTMREFMEEFWGKSEKLIFAEIKDFRDTARYTRIIQEMALLMDEFGMHGQFVFMSFNHEASKHNALRQYVPHIPFVGLNSNATSAEDLLREHTPHNMAANRRIDGGGTIFDREMIQALNHRGMPYGAWTYRTTEAVARDYTSGITAITNSHAHLLSEIPVTFVQCREYVEVDIGQRACITGTVMNRHGQASVVAVGRPAVISGRAYITDDAGGAAQGVALIVPRGEVRDFYLPGRPMVVHVSGNLFAGSEP